MQDQDLAVCMGRVLNTPPVNLARISIPQDMADLIPRDVAMNHKVLPVSRLGSKLFVAMADPLNVLAVDDVRRVTKMDVTPLIASEKSIVDKFGHLGSAAGGSMEDLIQEAEGDEEDLENIEVSKVSSDEVNLDTLAASSGEAPVIKLANLILVQAIKDRASGRAY